MSAITCAIPVCNVNGMNVRKGSSKDTYTVTVAVSNKYERKKENSNSDRNESNWIEELKT